MRINDRSENDTAEVAFPRGETFVRSIYGRNPNVDVNEDYVKKCSPDYFGIVSRMDLLCELIRRTSVDMAANRIFLRLHFLLRHDPQHARNEPGNRVESNWH